MKVQRSDVEKEQIKDLLRNDKTFYKVFQQDWTQKVLDDLRGRMHGRLPRNFLMNISGLIGTPTGIFKSSMGLQIALKLKPSLTIKKNVAFSVNQLLDKLKNHTEFYFCDNCFLRFTHNTFDSYQYFSVNEYHKKEMHLKCSSCDNKAEVIVLLTKLIFFLDEQTKTLKQSGLIRLANVVDTARERQICFITCGVSSYGFNFTTYHLKRIQESHDTYLPKKALKYAVYDDNRDIYYGSFNWLMTELSDHTWGAFWKEYSRQKTEFQRIAINQQIQSTNYGDMAKAVMELPDYQKCFKITSKGNKIMLSSMIESLIIKLYPDMTGEDRKHILNEIKFKSISS